MPIRYRNIFKQRSIRLNNKDISLDTDEGSFCWLEERMSIKVVSVHLFVWFDLHSAVPIELPV